MGQDAAPRPAPIHGPYIDDDDQRQLADLTLQPHPIRPDSLRITISAVGPNVEPIGGYRGVYGHNRYTAEELTWIESGVHSSDVYTEYETGGTRYRGRLARGRIGPVRERRLLPDGRIDFSAQTASAYVLELIVDTAVDEPGPRTTIVVVNEQPRLRCHYNIVNGQIVDFQLQSLGSDHEVAYSPPASNLIPVARQQEEPPVDIERWEERGLEGRWVLMQRDLLEHPDHTLTWIQFLNSRQEDELLEWVALYTLDAFRSLGVGTLLAERQAPQWIRVAAWHCTSPPSVGHTLQAATGILVKKHPAVAEHWLQKHQTQLDNWDTGLAYHYSSLVNDKIAPEDSGDLLPPLKPSQVFRFLDAPDDVEDFGDRLTVNDASIVFIHQVERAIDGVVVSGRRSNELLNRVRKLIHHPNLRIRQKAFLAFSYFAPTMSGQERFNDFLEIIDDRNQPPAIVESALLGYSYHFHPSVILKLHEIAEDPAHAGWHAAVSRIGDLGKGFSIELLTSIKRDQLTQKQAEILRDVRMKLQQANPAQSSPGAWNTFNNLSIAAFARLADSQYATAISQRVINDGKRMDKKERDKLPKYGPNNLKEIWLPGTKDEYSRVLRQLRSQIVSQKN